MATLVDQALVLRTWDYSETSQTVLLLTKAHGLLRGLAKGSKRPKSSFSGGFEVLTRGEVVAITKESTELANVTEWDLQEVFWQTRRDLAAHRAGLYIADLIQHAIIDHDPHPRVFDGAMAALRTLAGPDEIGRALVRFQWTLLAEIGYQLRVESGDVGRRPWAFSESSGTLSPPGPDGAPGWKVRPETVGLLRSLESGGELADAPAEATMRAAALLSVHLRSVLGRELATRDLVFGGDPRGSGRE